MIRGFIVMLLHWVGIVKNNLRKIKPLFGNKTEYKKTYNALEIKDVGYPFRFVFRYSI
jgi:hypothetical protein